MITGIHCIYSWRLLAPESRSFRNYFDIHFEVLPTLPRPTTSFEEEIPHEVAYDVDFVGHNYADIKKIQEVLKNNSLKSTRTRQSTHQYQKAKKDGKK